VVPWIERGFPAKPLDLKCKVDPQVGLLKNKVGHSRSDPNPIEKRFGHSERAAAAGGTRSTACN